MKLPRWRLLVSREENLISTSLKVCSSHVFCWNSPDPLSHVSPWPMKVSLGVWHLDGRSMKPLRGEVEPPQTFLSNTSPKLSSEKFEGQGNTSHSMYMAYKKFSQQNIVQIFTLPPPGCLLPRVHPGAACSPGRQAGDSLGRGHPHDVQDSMIHQTKSSSSIAQWFSSDALMPILLDPIASLSQFLSEVLTPAGRHHPTKAAVLEKLRPSRLAIINTNLSKKLKSSYLPIFPFPHPRCHEGEIIAIYFPCQGS